MLALVVPVERSLLLALLVRLDLLLRLDMSMVVVCDNVAMNQSVIFVSYDRSVRISLCSYIYFVRDNTSCLLQSSATSRRLLLVVSS